ncbi:MAG: hypothetical protein FWC50_14360 [Planctomycetaceae bacterium]|nr:hypothetical protein [Planctomycetaceae bacterium]
MPLDNDDDLNPYRVTEVSGEDEKSVPNLRFVRVEPVPKKITYSELDGAVYRTFMADKKRFLMLGLAHFLVIALISGIQIFIVKLMIWLGVDGDIQTSVSFAIHSIILACFYALFAFVASIEITLFWVRKEKIPRRFTRQRCFDILKTTFHVVIYFTICYLFLLSLWVFVALWAILMGASDPPEWYWVVLFAVTVILAVLFTFWIIARHAVGVVAIIDRRTGPIATFRSIRKFTRGNVYTFWHSFILHYFILYVLTVVTLGLFLVVTVPYLCCWFTVAYLMMTGQYESLGQQPDEW